MRKIVKQSEKLLGKLYVPCVLGVVSIILFALGYPFIKQFDGVIELNAIATQTIRANKTVEDVDATQKARDNAVQNVAKVYEKDETVVTTKLQQVTRFFQVLTNYRRDLAQQSDQQTAQEARISENVSRFVSSLQTDNADIYDYAYYFSDNVLTKLLTASEQDFKLYESLTKKIVESQLQDDIYPNTSDVTTAQNQAYAQLLAQTYSDTARDLVRDLMNPAIVATMVVNEAATRNASEQARESVTPVMITQGDVIVREGEVIGASVYKKIQLLGLENTFNNIQTLIGYAVVLVMHGLVTWYFIDNQSKSLSKRHLYVNIYAFVVVMMSVLTIMVMLVQNAGAEYFALLAPVGMVPFFVVPKAKRRLALLALSFLVALSYFVGDSGNVLQSPLVWRFYTLIGLFATIIVSGREKKTFGFYTAFLLSVYVGLITSLALFNHIDIFSQTFVMMCLYAIVNAIVTVGFVKIGQPYFDLLFEDKAILRLIELSNPNHPLLKELISNAPGTYHHSIMVANLSANAVELIGGDSLFTRVACYYHDIGKLNNPMFFVENLPAGMENPHKLLLPRESAEIIFNHVSKGVERLKKEGLPQAIIDICAQHHGTTVMKYFYVQAKEQDDTVTEDMFRYPGPKPSTKESAVVSIADTVEAAARAMKTPTIEMITQLVKETIHSRILDGQFDECPITIEELKIVEQSLITGLSSSYHTRVEYPKLAKRKDKHK